MKEWRIRYRGIAHYSVWVLAETEAGARAEADPEIPDLIDEYRLDYLTHVESIDLGETFENYWLTQVTLRHGNSEFSFNFNVRAKGPAEAESRAAELWNESLEYCYGDIAQTLIKLGVDNDPAAFCGDGKTYTVSACLADGVEDIKRRQESLKRFFTVSDFAETTNN